MNTRVWADDCAAMCSYEWANKTIEARRPADRKFVNRLIDTDHGASVNSDQSILRNRLGSPAVRTFLHTHTHKLADRERERERHICSRGLSSFAQKFCVIIVCSLSLLSSQLNKVRQRMNITSHSAPFLLCHLMFISSHCEIRSLCLSPLRSLSLSQIKMSITFDIFTWAQQRWGKWNQNKDQNQNENNDEWIEWPIERMHYELSREKISTHTHMKILGIHHFCPPDFCVLSNLMLD